MSSLESLQKRAFENKVQKGFNVANVEKEFCLTYAEMAEAYEAWLKKEGDVGEELADVLIYLLGLSEMVGVNLGEEVEKKMEKNERRVYEQKNGVLQKVKED